MKYMHQCIAEEKPVIVIPKAALLVVSLQIFAAIIFKTLLLALMVCVMYAQLTEFHQGLIIPIKMEHMISLEEQQTAEVCEAFRIMWGHEASISIVEGIKLGAKSIRAKVVDPILIAVLMDSESQGKMNAISSKGYKGLMQAPSATKIAEVDIVHGCKILDDKLNWKKMNPNKDLRTALALYKGGLSGEAFGYADEVIHRYKSIKKQLAS